MCSTRALKWHWKNVLNRGFTVSIQKDKKQKLSLQNKTLTAQVVHHFKKERTTVNVQH